MATLIITSPEQLSSIIKSSIDDQFKTWSHEIRENQSKEITQKYYSRKQASIRLGVSIPMVDKLAAQGKLTRKKIGGKTVFDSAQVEELAEPRATAA